MKKNLYHDEDNLITWDIISSMNSITEHKKKYQKRLKNYVKHLNTWDDEDISSFITRQDLGDYIEDLLNDEYQNNTACFALDPKGHFMGVVILSPPYDKSVTLDYVILNEKFRGQGLGTRMIKSIRDNVTQILQSQTHIEEINSLIRDNNYASQKAFIKNGFYVKPAHDKLSFYGVYTCHIKEKENVK